MKLKYFETHSHPDHPFLVDDLNGYIEEMRASGIDKMVVAPITEESNYMSMELFPKDKYPEVLFGKGLHPKHAFNTPMWDDGQMERFKNLINDERVVALKSGLDFCKKKLQPHQIQREYDFLLMFMKLAEEYNKSLILHVREAKDEAIAFFEENPLKVEAELHCYNYDTDAMHRFIELGVRYFGIGGKITSPEGDSLREAVKNMPMEMILLESDSPFVKVAGETEKYNTSARSLPVVAKKIAELKGASVEKVAEQTYKNACRFFGV